jgi:hypothetical protein
MVRLRFAVRKIGIGVAVFIAEGIFLAFKAWPLVRHKAGGECDLFNWWTKGKFFVVRVEDLER